MATFGELITKASRRIQDDLNTAVSSSEVGDAINTAIKYWKNEPFWFNEGSFPIITIAGDPVLPTEPFLILRSMRLPYQQMTYDIPAITNSAYDAVNLQGRGRPYAYTYRAGQYELYWYPDIAYTVVLEGIKDYADLSASTDENDFTVYADQIILYDALSRLAAEFRTDPTIAEYYANRTQDERKNLTRRSNKMWGTGRMQIYDEVY